MTLMFGKLKRCISKKWRNHAKGQECTLQIPGVCNHDPATTVCCHLRMFSGAGINQKPDDWWSIDACSACHDALDGRGWQERPIGYDDILRALRTTQQRRYQADILQVWGDSA